MRRRPAWERELARLYVQRSGGDICSTCCGYIPVEGEGCSDCPTPAPPPPPGPQPAGKIRGRAACEAAEMALRKAASVLKAERRRPEVARKVRQRAQHGLTFSLEERGREWWKA